MPWLVSTPLDLTENSALQLYLGNTALPALSILFLFFLAALRQLLAQVLCPLVNMRWFEIASPELIPNRHCQLLTTGKILSPFYISDTQNLRNKPPIIIAAWEHSNTTVGLSKAWATHILHASRGSYCLRIQASNTGQSAMQTGPLVAGKAHSFEKK